MLMHETDCLFMIGQAVGAPSGHNTQPWKFRVTDGGIAHAYLNQPNEVPALAGKMAKLAGLVDEHPAVLIRLGYARPMPYSPRRPVESCLVA